MSAPGGPWPDPERKGFRKEDRQKINFPRSIFMRIRRKVAERKLVRIPFKRLSESVHPWTNFILDLKKDFMYRLKAMDVMKERRRNHRLNYLELGWKMPRMTRRALVLRRAKSTSGRTIRIRQARKRGHKRRGKRRKFSLKRGKRPLLWVNMEHLDDVQKLKTIEASENSFIHFTEKVLNRWKDIRKLQTHVSPTHPVYRAWNFFFPMPRIGSWGAKALEIPVRIHHWIFSKNINPVPRFAGGDPNEPSFFQRRIAGKFFPVTLGSFCLGAMAVSIGEAKLSNERRKQYREYLRMKDDEKARITKEIVDYKAKIEADFLKEKMEQEARKQRILKGEEDPEDFPIGYIAANTKLLADDIPIMEPPIYKQVPKTKDQLIHLRELGNIHRPYVRVGPNRGEYIHFVHPKFDAKAYEQMKEAIQMPNVVDTNKGFFGTVFSGLFGRPLVVEGSTPFPVQREPWWKDKEIVRGVDEEDDPYSIDRGEFIPKLGKFPQRPFQFLAGDSQDNYTFYHPKDLEGNELSIEEEKYRAKEWIKKSEARIEKAALAAGINLDKVRKLLKWKQVDLARLLARDKLTTEEAVTFLDCPPGTLETFLVNSHEYWVFKIFENDRFLGEEDATPQPDPKLVRLYSYPSWIGGMAPSERVRLGRKRLHEKYALGGPLPQPDIIGTLFEDPSYEDDSEDERGDVPYAEQEWEDWLRDLGNDEELLGEQEEL